MFLKNLLAFDFSTKCFSKSLLLRTILFVRRLILIRLRARVFYEQIVNEAQPSWLSLVENEGE